MYEKYTVISLQCLLDVRVCVRARLKCSFFNKHQVFPHMYVKYEANIEQSPRVVDAHIFL